MKKIKGLLRHKVKDPSSEISVGSSAERDQNSDLIARNCYLCRRVEILPYGERVRNIPTTTLDHNARNGCLGCSVLLNCFRAFEPEGIHILHVLVNKWGSISLESPESFKTYVEILNASSEPVPWNNVDCKPTLLQPTEQRFERFVTDRYKHCLTNHDRCREIDAFANKSTLKPSRLIYIGQPSCERSLHLVDCLHESDVGKMEMRYTTLSHCWGAKQFLKTTTENIDQFKRNVPWADLPKTFQEAILVTRKLGLVHIWIDSLCIIQDDEHDWAVESSKMGGIYQNAHLTIAATGAFDSDEGLFFPRGIHAIPTPQSWSRGQVCVRRFLDHPGIHFRAIRSRSFPLARRGWALQELTLSPRVVHFTREEIIWDCESCEVCECGHGRDDYTDRMHRIFRLKELGMGWNEYNPITAWNMLVERYTECQLKYSRDMLPALSGLATYFEGRGLRGYRAGLWQSAFLEQLNWRADEPGRRDEQSDQALCNVPSWSWCSVTAANISTPLRMGKDTELLPRAELVNVSCSPSTADPKGMLSGGHVILRAKLVPFRIYFRPSLTEATERVHGYEHREKPYVLRHLDGRILQRDCKGDSGNSTEYDQNFVGYAATLIPDVPLLSKWEQIHDGETVYFVDLFKQICWKLDHGGMGWDANCGIFVRLLNKDVDATTIAFARRMGHTGEIFRRIGWGWLGKRGQLEVQRLFSQTSDNCLDLEHREAPYVPQMVTIF